MEDFIHNYRTTNPNIYKNLRNDGQNQYISQVIETIDLRYGFAPTTSKTSFAIIGFCCDEGVRRNLGRIGAKEGPLKIREQLAKLPIHFSNHPIVFDLGNIDCADGNLEQAQIALAKVVAIALRAGTIPIVLGGGHETAFGHYLGLKEANLNNNLGIINCDAHFDMRDSINNEATSGTPFKQIADDCLNDNTDFDYNCIGIQAMSNCNNLFQTANNYNVSYVCASEINAYNNKSAFNMLDNLNKRANSYYLSICLDVFNAAIAPGVSAPAPLGLTLNDFMPVYKTIIASGKVVSFDIVELNPNFDLDNRTARLAASLIWTFIHNMLGAHIAHA